MLTPPLIVKSIACFSILGVLADALPQSDPAWVSELSKLGMTGLLGLAVVVLWKKLQEKDALLMQNYKSMTDSLAATKALHEKMTETLERIEAAVEHLSTVRMQIGHKERV